MGKFCKHFYATKFYKNAVFTLLKFGRGPFYKIEFYEGAHFKRLNFGKGHILCIKFYERAAELLQILKPLTIS